MFSVGFKDPAGVMHKMEGVVPATKRLGLNVDVANFDATNQELTSNMFFELGAILEANQIRPDCILMNPADFQYLKNKSDDCVTCDINKGTQNNTIGRSYDEVFVACIDMNIDVIKHSKIPAGEIYMMDSRVIQPIAINRASTGEPQILYTDDSLRENDNDGNECVNFKSTFGLKITDATKLVRVFGYNKGQTVKK